MLTILIYIAVLSGGCALGYGIFYYIHKEKADVLREKLANITKTSEEILRKGEQKAQSLIFEAQKDIDRKHQKIDSIEERLIKKEEKIDEKYELLDKQKEEIILKKQELQKHIEEQKNILSTIAKLTPEQAKDQLFDQIEKEYNREINGFIEKFKSIKTEEADKEAVHILTKVLPRVSMNSVSEFTVSSIDLPTEDMKGKLIGREGRNVAYFEKITGVEVLIDDTPLVVKLSSYDPEKRFVAVKTLEKLIKDGRINPVYIEKTYNETANGLDNLLIEKGKEALAMLNIPMMKPDIVRYIGQFHLRSSYGQNLWIHSIEVAKLAELLANEMGLDALQAKKAGLLHDIGKVIATTGQSHTKIGADVLRKYGFDDTIVNAAEAHHYDVPLTTAIGWIVTAADAISAGRPGARFNTKALFIEKMTELEKLISSVQGVDKVHIMQAGREIMIFVNPAQVDDLGVQKLIKDVAIKVEDQLDYPGIIRVVALRETKVIDYLR